MIIVDHDQWGRDGNGNLDIRENNALILTNKNQTCIILTKKTNIIVKQIIIFQHIIKSGLTNSTNTINAGKTKSADVQLRRNESEWVNPGRKIEKGWSPEHESKV